jgi:hypothetical protein
MSVRRLAVLGVPHAPSGAYKGHSPGYCVVNDESRMNQLVARGIDGVITDRLDIMQLLGKGTRAVRH